jgi:outer membrane lipoprotein-sorting protein
MIYQSPGNHQPPVEDDNILDRAIVALRGESVPDGPSEELFGSTLTALRRATAPPQPAPIKLPRRISFSWARVAALFVLVVSVIAAIILSLNSSPVAFADVIRKVRESRTLTFNAQMNVPGARQSISMKFFMEEGGRFRMETAEPSSPMHSIAVFDAHANKGVMLMPRAKMAVVLTNFNDFVKQQQKGNGADGGGGPGDFVKMLETLKKLGDKPEKELGEWTFDGRRLRGFVARQEGVAFTVWADPKTGEPVRIELEPPGAPASMKIAFTDIHVDPPIDPAKFKLDIPAGYNQMQINLPHVEGGEASLIAALRGYTSRSGGAFPRSLTDWSDYAAVLKADAVRAAVTSALTPQPAAASASFSADALEFMANVAQIMPFLATLPKEGYAYLGRGKTTSGDKDQIVFWYKKGDGTYRAVFGDLTARDVKAEEVPN